MSSLPSGVVTSRMKKNSDSSNWSKVDPAEGHNNTLTIVPKLSLIAVRSTPNRNILR